MPAEDPLEVQSIRVRFKVMEKKFRSATTAYTQVGDKPEQLSDSDSLSEDKGRDALKLVGHHLP